MLKLLIFSSIIFLTTSPLGWAEEDPVKDLISDEKEKINAWIADSSETITELPPAFLKGEDDFVEIFSPHLNFKNQTHLCEMMELDELIELSNDTVGKEEVKLNVSLPRVQERLSQSCLVRPKDPFYAVGRGENSLVFFDEFFVRKTGQPCSSNFPYRLQVSYTPNVKPMPLFFSTDPKLREGPNDFRTLWNLNRTRLTERAKAALVKELVFLEEFKIDTYKIEQSTRTSILIFARRMMVSDEDIGLPDEMMLLWKENRMQTLWLEKVNPRKRNGRVEIEGVIDYNADGHIDVLFNVFYPRCALSVLAEGRFDEPIQIRLPGSTCQCKG